jgi:hypothetical protein
MKNRKSAESEQGSSSRNLIGHSIAFHTEREEGLLGQNAAPAATGKRSRGSCGNYYPRSDSRLSSRQGRTGHPGHHHGILGSMCRPHAPHQRRQVGKDMTVHDEDRSLMRRRAARAQWSHLGSP